MESNAEKASREYQEVSTYSIPVCGTCSELRREVHVLKERVEELEMLLDWAMVQRDIFKLEANTFRPQCYAPVIGR